MQRPNYLEELDALVEKALGRKPTSSKAMCKSSTPSARKVQTLATGFEPVLYTAHIDAPAKEYAMKTTSSISRAIDTAMSSALREVLGYFLDIEMGTGHTPCEVENAKITTSLDGTCIALACLRGVLTDGRCVTTPSPTSAATPSPTMPTPLPTMAPVTTRDGDHPCPHPGPHPGSDLRHSGVLQCRCGVPDAGG
eukprot:Sspe_Gene.177::Locus_62_Transcript_2_3_Confidence_0.182_Length_782::g.177::m.177